MFFPAIFAAKNQSLEYMSNIDREHRITYKAGITRTPSDFLCQDGELAECINLTTDNEELKPIVMPAEYITSAVNQNDETIDMPRFLYIHKYNDIDTYIGYMNEDSTNILVFGKVEGSTFHLVGTLNVDRYNLQYEDIIQFSTIGKILIVGKSDGLYYFMWKKDGSSYVYEPYGKNFPAPKVEFKLGGRNSKEYKSEQKAYSILYNVDSDTFDISAGQQNAWNDLVQGLYLDLKRKIKQEKRFHGSFCIRAALELYTGDFYMITNPIFMLNHFSEYGVAKITDQEVHLVQMSLYGQDLYYRFDQDYSMWSDIIKNVVLFVTQEADTADATVDATCYQNYSPNLDPQSPIAFFMADNIVYRDSKGLSEVDLYRVLKSIPDSDLTKTIKSGVYYKLCEIGLKGDGNWHNANDHFDTHTLENLATQKRLEEDDYYSYSSLMAEVLFSYNSRLNLASVSRGLFEGFGYFMPFTTPYGGSVNPDSNYEFLVTISTDNGDITVSHQEPTNQIQGIFFYYPDPRAKHVVIKKDGSQILNVDLMEHPTLNGAYYFAGVSPDMVEPSSASGDIPAVSTSYMERLPNYVITSEVNNPFMFGKKGYNKVGTGKVLAISTTTMALSQDQFGKTPLIVFSESGVWGMQVDNTGLFDYVHPFTRDVAINPKNIIQTDGAVFFVSKRGLMMVTTIVTNDRGVRCVSEQMNGRPFDYHHDLGNPALRTEWYPIVSACQNSTDSFQDFVCGDKCSMAYDYTESRLIIINPDYDFNYIMSLKDGTISKSTFPIGVTNVVNNYPDYLIQTGSAVYSCYEKEREEAVTDRLPAFLITRPMKLAGPISKASLRQLKHVGFWEDGESPLSCVKTKIWLSDDMRNWYEDTSRFGTAAKYYRMVLFIKMLPSERLSGTIITSQERRTNNMR